MYLRPQKPNKKLDELISYTNQIIKEINLECSIHDKMHHILEYFSCVTSYKNFKLTQNCIKRKIPKAYQFSKSNVQYVEKLYNDIILSDYFDNNPIISIVEFSEYLTNISDMYGVSIYNFHDNI